MIISLKIQNSKIYLRGIKLLERKLENLIGMYTENERKNDLKFNSLKSGKFNYNVSGHVRNTNGRMACRCVL